MGGALGMMVLIMKANGWMEKEMARVYFLKLTDLFIKANGWMTKNMEKVKLFTKMEMKFLGSGNMIDLMAWLK